jgi:16S rRNA (guanine(966)-N(2))-methyltransferase RsmD
MAQPRIIGGKARGIRITSVPGDTTRPITDRVKEALFNIIGPDIVDSNFLDLFGGTGSVGIEALSRGAKSCTFLDFAPQAVRVIKQNLATTHLEGNAFVRQGDAFQFLRASPQNIFDYIYIAPPQYKKLWIDAILLLDDNLNLLSEDGWVIVQIDPVEDTEIKLVNLVEFDRRRYGSTLLLFYSRPEQSRQN